MAIIAILIGHLRQYLSIEATTLSTSVASTFTYFGLSLFIFVSGYSLMIKRPSFDHLNDLKKYLIKRVSRIYPLYWIVLVLLLVFDALPNSDLLGNIIIFSGFQILVYPVLVQNTLYWFVSAIVVFYLMFPVILYAAQKMRRRFDASVLAVSTVLFLGLVAINVVFGTIDISIFLYYWLFVSGIVIGSKIKFSQIGRSRSMVAGAASSLPVSFWSERSRSSSFPEGGCTSPIPGDDRAFPGHGHLHRDLHPVREPVQEVRQEQNFRHGHRGGRFYLLDLICSPGRCWAD